MKTARMLSLAACVMAIIAAGGAGAPFAQETPPMETKGVKADVLHALDLGQQIEGMKGHQLRWRLITIEPGGVVKRHSHADRPSGAYVLQGAYNEFREGVGWTEYREGESWVEGKDVTHWGENRGTKPLILLGVDIVEQQ